MPLRTHPHRKLFWTQKGDGVWWLQEYKNSPSPCKLLSDFEVTALETFDMKNEQQHPLPSSNKNEYCLQMCEMHLYTCYILHGIMSFIWPCDRSIIHSFIHSLICQALLNPCSVSDTVGAFGEPKRKMTLCLSFVCVPMTKSLPACCLP